MKMIDNLTADGLKAFYSRHSKAIKIWAFLLVTFFLIFKGFMQQPLIEKNRTKIAGLEDQIEYEKTRMEEVKALKTKVNTDEYIEKMAREKLGLIKENEKVFIDISQQN